MYPFFEIGAVEFSSFAVMRSGAIFVFGYLLWLQWMREPNFRTHKFAWLGVIVATAFGGWGATQLWGTLRVKILHSMGIQHAFLSGSEWVFAGISGVLLGGVLSLSFSRLPTLAGLDMMSPGLALSHAVYRLGCFLSGDGCYGPPTDLPWGVAFTKGTTPTTEPVHPTMLYEAVPLLLLSIFLWNVRAKLPAGFPLALLAAFTSLICFSTQFYFAFIPVKILGLTEVQWNCLIVGITSILLLIVRSHRLFKHS